MAIAEMIVKVKLDLLLSLFAILMNSKINQVDETNTKTKNVHSLIKISAEVITTNRLPVNALFKKLFKTSIVFEFVAN